MNISNLPKLILAASLSLGLAACGGNDTKPDEQAAAADIKVKMTPKMASVEVMHHGQPFSIVRNQDTNNTVNAAFAKTSRPCPPFCIRPYSLGGDVETVAELEVIDYIKKSGSDDSIMIVDARTPDWVAKGTLPNAVNVPFKDVVRSKGASDVSIADALETFGAEETDKGWDFSKAKTLVMFCNGMWCGQSPLAIDALRKMGYPESKLKWYRDGMQSWEILGLPTVKPAAE